MPACLAITTERAFDCPLHPQLSASFCRCKRHEIIYNYHRRFSRFAFKGVAYQYKVRRNASSVPGLSILPARYTRTLCAIKLRQQVRDVIHKLPGRPCLEATLHAGKRPSCVGPEQSVRTEGDEVMSHSAFRAPHPRRVARNCPCSAPSGP